MSLTPTKEHGGVEKAEKQRSIFIRLAPFLIVCGFGSLIMIPIYRKYGINMFLPDFMKRLDLSPEEWRAVLRGDADGVPKTLVLVGGPHRGGTTVLWDRLRAHPAVRDLGDARDTGVDYSEGLFLQDVYPKFGQGDLAAWGGGGSGSDDGGGGGGRGGPSMAIGRYATSMTEQGVHWGATHRSVTLANQARVLNAWGHFWGLGHLKGKTAGKGSSGGSGSGGGAPPPPSVLLEKSPPNLHLGAYLQALLNLGHGNTCDRSSDGSSGVAADEASRALGARGEHGGGGEEEEEDDDDEDEDEAAEFDGAGGEGGVAAQALPHQGLAAAAAPRSTCVTRFVFITRHPIANALAHRALHEAKHLSIRALVEHWVVVHEYAAADVYRGTAAAAAVPTTGSSATAGRESLSPSRSGRRSSGLDPSTVKRLTLEAFAADPERHLVDLWTWLGLAPTDSDSHKEPAAASGSGSGSAAAAAAPPLATLAAAAAAGVRRDPNAKYRGAYCRAALSDPAGAARHRGLHAALNGRVGAVNAALGLRYDLDEWPCLAGTVALATASGAAASGAAASGAAAATAAAAASPGGGEF